MEQYSNKKLIIANWKMNPASSKEAEALFFAVLDVAEKLKNIDIVICPPFIYLESFSKLLKANNHKLKAGLGAQDLFYEKFGAYTGEISAVMIKNLGVKYVIIGHSERRWIIGESDEIVNKKLKSALGSGLKAILCVGEKERDENFHRFIANQVDAALKNVPVGKIKNLIIAYEPVWAIGSGIPDNPKESAEMIMYIRKIIAKKYNLKIAKNMKILYGGSINSKNIEGFLNQEGINGALVGGASLKPHEFLKIMEIANKS